MSEDRLREAYHIERAFAAQQGIARFPCACERCHGFKIQEVEVVQSHHRKYGRDRNLQEPLLPNAAQQPDLQDNAAAEPEEVEQVQQFFDANDYDTFETVAPNTEANLQEMAENFFARVDEIHQQFSEGEDSILDFKDLSSEEDEADAENFMEELLHEAAEPLYQGSSTSRLQFSIVLMSLCTLFSISHHCLDEVLTFLKHDVLPVDNTCPKSSYEMKTLLSKLGLSHESIHCCDCGKTLYWKEKAKLDKCPECQKSRYIEGSMTVPLRLLQFFSLIKRLRRLFRCPELAKHMTWHCRSHSQDGKMRSVVDREQWHFIDNNFPEFSSSSRNIRMGLALDGVNPHSLQSSKHSVWPVMVVFYNLPPYLVTKRFFISLTMIIPGPNSPTEDTIDVYLQPLVHELKKLWRGVPAVDMSKPEGPDRRFKMRGLLMWTINDYPAYTLISGQVGKGYTACTVCGEGTASEHSAEAGKTVFLGHRRWLKENHMWRSARTSFNGHANHDSAPPRQSGISIVRHGAWRESYLQCGGRRNSEHDPVKATGVKRISILFELPYWAMLPIRHLLDPMHCEKNLCENLVRTLFGETDGVKSREDMRARGIRRHLHLQANPDGQTYFMPDAPYVLSKAEKEEFLATLREFKFPTNYVGPLKQRIQDGKLTGLKTHDYHILLQQVLPVCLRNIGSPDVMGAIMRVSRVFRKLCAKVIDSREKVKMLEDIAETMCTLEKELPPSIFVVMMHLPIHLVEELFICGPVHTRWMYPFERYMKGLKGFVKNKAKPEGSMAFGYLREEAIGFLNEYLAEYTPTTKRAWDDEEEAGMYDEILEGSCRDRNMSPDFRKLIHAFVLDSADHMDVYRSRYAEAVLERDAERERYRREERRYGRRQRFAYPLNLQKVPEFSVWIMQEVRSQQRSGAILDPMVVDSARGPLEVSASYKSMYAYGNHFRVISCERSLKTADSGVAATFRQVCRNGIRDINQVEADVEYVGHIEEILELNYRRHCVVVFLCDFVKANYRGENATIKKDKWGFTLANYNRRPRVINRDSFAFPRHCEQVFYCNAREAPGWKIVLRKEVRGRRVLPGNEEDWEPEIFRMGSDEEFEGLRPQREVGDVAVAAVATGQNVLVQEVLIAGRQRTMRGRGSTVRRSGVGGRGTWRPTVGRAAGGSVSDQGHHGLGVRFTANLNEGDKADEDRTEEDFLYAQHLSGARGGHIRGREDDEGDGRRRNRRRMHLAEDDNMGVDSNVDDGSGTISEGRTSSPLTEEEDSIP